MSIIVNALRASRRRIAVGVLALALVASLSPASAGKKSSKPEERQRFLAVTEALEKAPLDPALEPDRKWALEWLIAAPDVTVDLCSEPLDAVMDSKYPYGGEILFQSMFAMGALAIKEPAKATDPVAQQLAGIEGALVAYRSILKAKPDAKSPALDSLLETQAQGQLAALAGKVWAGCSSKK